MKIKFDYYIKRKLDNKLMQIMHVEMSEEEIIEAIKSKLRAPINYNMEDENGEGDFIFSDISIGEVCDLH